VSKKKSRKPAGKKKAGKRREKRERAWTVVTFDELDAWRAERKLPKKRMAELVGVTNSTYHNWARGSAVATLNTQERIRGLMDGRDAASELSEPTPSSPDVVSATATIVAGYLNHSKRNLTSEEVAELVRSIRRALET
jgi:transcriptional regulator with XRE-family HTH domain